MKTKTYMRVVMGLAGLLLASRAFADGTVSVTNTSLLTFKGWGVKAPANSRVLQTYADGSTAWGGFSWLPDSGFVTLTGQNYSPILQAIKDSGVQIGRVELAPEIGLNNGTLDAARLQDVLDELGSLSNAGITQYILTMWSPPSYMKTPDQVRWGQYNGHTETLNPAYAGNFADYYVAVLTGIKNAGRPAPLSISIQNEVDVSTIYDSCTYDAATYQAVAKQLRQKLDAKNDSWFGNIKIMGPEPSGWDAMDSYLGTASASGFATMNSDTAFGNAIGAFVYHSYYTSGRIKTLDQAMATYPGRDRWMTEYSTYMGICGELRPGTGNSELDWAFQDLRRMAGDIVDFKSNYWFFWGFWHLSGGADDENLTWGQPGSWASDGGAHKTKAYYAFQKLWTTVKGGWTVQQCSTTDPDLRTDNSSLINSGSGDEWSAPVEIIAFQSPDSAKTCLLLMNPYGTSKSITGISGLKGTTADIYRTDGSNDMAFQGSRSISGGGLQGGALSLPAFSVTVVVTSGGSTGSKVNWLTGFEGGDPQPNWNDTADLDFWPNGNNPTSISGYLSGISPECSVRSSEQFHTGNSALMFSGTANGGAATYLYYKVFDFSSSPISILSNSTLSYWIYPQVDNARYVGVDFHCTDGTVLRDSGINDSNGFSLHPNAGHGGNIALNSWTQINASLAGLAGKTIDRIWVAYDRPGSTGQYRGYIDDINIDPPTAAVPGKPTGVTAVAGNAQVTLSWVAPTGTVTSYKLYRSTTSGGQGTTVYKSALTGSSYTDTGLTNGTTYYYKVAAVNASGTGAQSSEVSGKPVATVTVPTAPTSLAATAGNAQVALTWAAVSGASSYSVYRGTTAGGESTTAIVSGLTSASYTNTGLTNGTMYYYKVKATNSAGTSGYSNEANAKPIASATKVNDNGSGAVYAGTWTTGTDSGYYTGDYHTSSVVGSSVTFSFSGTSVSWIGGKYPNHGIASISVDGGAAVTVDTYASSWLKQQTLYTKSGLAAENHTLKITLLNSKNASSTGYNQDVDAFLYQ